jgi:hypothetical protein
MRTTLNIDDEVLAAAREIARRRRTTAGAIISELARRALAQAKPESAVAPAEREPEAFVGFRPLPAAGRIVGNETVERIREEEGI